MMLTWLSIGGFCVTSNFKAKRRSLNVFLDRRLHLQSLAQSRGFFIATDGRAALWLANALFWLFAAPLWLVFKLMRKIRHAIRDSRKHLLEDLVLQIL